MFEKLFAKYRAISRHKNSPLAVERLEYLEHCSAQGMSIRSLKEIATYLLIIIEFLQLDTRECKSVSAHEVLEQAERWMNREPPPSNLKNLTATKRRFVKHAIRWLQFMGRLSPSEKETPPYESYLQQFLEHMNTEQGFSPASIDVRFRAAKDFLHQVYRDLNTLTDITITHIDEILTRKAVEDNYATSSLQGYASNVRCFMRFAENHCWCAEGLSEMIETPRVYKHSNIPSGPSWTDVQKVLVATEGNHSTDIRDRAILLLFSVYGFRSAEVARLRLDDIDWEKDLIYVYRPKQRKKQTYPLAPSVGTSISRYLREVRPTSPYRELFLLMRAPFTPVSNVTLYEIVARRLKSLDIESNHYGPHSLRHACATRLLQQNHSLKEIGDYLGHKAPEATRVYAKVDMERLRQVGDFDVGVVL